MSKRYPGGIINRSAPVVVGPVDGEGGSAPGIWTLEQASGYVKQGTWPRPIIPKSIYTWGSNANGQLGQNIAYTINRSSPVQVGTTDWSKISALGGTGMASIKTNGTLWTWGNNGSGRLGQNNIIQRSSPTQVGALTNWQVVGSSGDEAGHAIKTNGTLWSWGNNSYGTLGNNSTANQSSPVQIGSDTNWLSVGGGNNATIALKTNGTLWSWGNNTYGALGQNISYTISRSSPVQIGTDTNWSYITNNAGSGVCFAIKTNGTLWAWGQNSSGELGLNNTVNRSSPTQVGALTNWAKVSTGNGTTLAVKTDGTLWAWGGNSSGELGLNLPTGGYNKSSPVQVGTLTNWATVTSRSSSVFAVKTDGTLWSWGDNTAGKLGQNTAEVNRRSSPVQVGALTTWLSTSNGYGVIALANPALEASNLWVTGLNSLDIGTLAQGNFVYKSSPVQISSQTTWSTMATASSSGAFASAIKTDGTLWTWGQNGYGQLGQNNLIYRSVATQVGANTNWFTLANGLDHVVAIKTDGTLWSWGRNNKGQLGQSNLINRSSPVQVGALTNWLKVSSGYAFNLAIKTDGTLWSWGNNSVGQLGQNNIINSSSPAQVGSLTTWLNAVAGYSFSVATKTDGTLWAWGRNDSGQVGQNNAINYSSPVQVGLLTTWNKVGASNISSFSIKNDGTFWAWGGNSDGQLGQNDIVSRSSPVQVGALTNWSSVAGGVNIVGALKTNGTLWGIGANTSGQLGLGDVVNRSSPTQVGSNTNWSAVFANSSGIAGLTS